MRGRESTPRCSNAMTSASASSIRRNVSHETVRISLRSPCSSSRGQVRSASASNSSTALRARVGRLAQRLARECDQADAVGHLLPDQRHRHHEVLVGAEARARRQRQVGREGLAERRAWLAGEEPRRVARCHVTAAGVARAGRGELREELGLRADRRVVRRVGAVDELLGRGLREQRAHVERVPERRVEADVRVPQRADRVQVGDRAVREHDLRAGMALEQAARGRVRTAAPRGRCGRGSERAARRPARRRRRAAGARSRSPAGSCAA